MKVLDKISLAGLVPVIKVEKAEDAVPLCRALAEGGLPVAEITFRTAAAPEAIRRVAAELPDVILGAGTVLTIEQAKQAIEAGATYIVSPGLNPKVVKWCVDNNIPVLPGCANPSDIETAIELGLDTVKFFPAEALGGLKLIKAMAAPYGNIKFVPTGGINEKNALDYLAFNKVAAIGGSWMVPTDAIAAGDWDKIRSIAASAVNLMLGLEIAHIGVNCENEAEAKAEGALLAKLFALPVRDCGAKCDFVGDMFEVMKAPGRGAKGHIAIGTRDIVRAKFHMELRGFEFDEPMYNDKGKMSAVYLKNDIAGFAIHLLQK